MVGFLLTLNLLKLIQISKVATVVALITFFVSMLPERAHSKQDVSAICDQAAKIASAKTGVPTSVLQAISLSETGRKRDGAMRPWPWTVNMEGKGVWFDNPDDAKAYVFKHYKRGARSFDIGCFQINYKWHGHEFSSIEEMFEPAPNAQYAAKFLLQLYKEKGDWGSAAGAYHSRTPKYANKYEKRFKSYHTDILRKGVELPNIIIANDAPANSQQAPAIIRVNTYPLLRLSKSKSHLGSLVQLGSLQTAKGLFPADGEDG